MALYSSSMVEQKPVPLFFAFPDGVFQYVCAECNALCCRGQGFGGNVEREMGFLLKTYPEMASMVTGRQRDIIDVATPLGRCFFLQDNNLCRIQAEHGAARKPGVCTIFPFNRFTRIGDTVLISPHFLCPLRVEVPARPGPGTGTHSIIETSIRDSAMLEARYIKWYLGASKLPSGETANSVLVREAEFRAQATAALGKARFMDLLVAAGGRRRELQDMVKRSARLMAWAPAARSDGPDRIDDVLIAMSQSLLLGPRILPQDQRLQVLALCERLVRTAFTPAMPTPQPQAIYGVLQHALPVLRMLTEAKLAVPRKKPKPPFGRPELVFAGFMLFRDIERIGHLPALESAFKRLALPADRSVLAHHLASITRA